MTARLSHPLVAVGQNDVFVSVDLKAAAFSGGQRNPVNLALVIDRSGSMSGNKIAQAKLAAKALVSQIHADDRLTIIHYGSDVKSLEGLVGTPQNKARMAAYVDSIWDDGGTNTSGGLEAGISALVTMRTDYRVNRMILISDGQPTEGRVEPRALQGIVKNARALGISTSSLGVGLDFNESLMASLAEVGAGAYGFIENSEKLASIFTKDLNAAATQVARGVELQFQVPAGVEFVEVFGRSSRVSPLADAQLVSVSLPDLAAEQAESVVAHFVVQGHAANERILVSNVSLNYFDLKTEKSASERTGLETVASLDASLVRAKQDPTTALFAANARAAKNSERANELLEQGDRKGAEAALEESSGFFENLRGIVSGESLGRSTDALAGKIERLNKAKDTESIKAYRKTAKSENLKDFGATDSTY
jgi:Ca-activated chloride channel homolog